jgi:hypothetical protein
MISTVVTNVMAYSMFPTSARRPYISQHLTPRARSSLLPAEPPDCRVIGVCFSCHCGVGACPNLSDFRGLPADYPRIQEVEAGERDVRCTGATQEDRADCRLFSKTEADECCGRMDRSRKVGFFGRCFAGLKTVPPCRLRLRPSLSRGICDFSSSGCGESTRASSSVDFGTAASPAN